MGRQWLKWHALGSMASEPWSQCMLQQEGKMRYIKYISDRELYFMHHHGDCNSSVIPSYSNWPSTLLRKLWWKVHLTVCMYVYHQIRTMAMNSWWASQIQQTHTHNQEYIRDKSVQLCILSHNIILQIRRSSISCIDMVMMLIFTHNGGTITQTEWVVSVQRVSGLAKSDKKRRHGKNTLFFICSISRR